MKNYVQAGSQVSVPAPYDVVSGQGVLVGSLFGVAVHAAATAAPVELALEGVYDLAKATGAAWTVGARIYWDDTNKVCTTTASTNKLVGVALAVAASDATLGRVRLTAAFTL